MRAGWDRGEAPDNSSPGKGRRRGTPPPPPWVPKSLRPAPARDQGAERRCAGRRARALRACERKCDTRVTAPLPPFPDPASGECAVPSLGPVRRTGSQARVLSTGLSGTAGLASALRCPGRMCSRESSQRAGGSRLSAPERNSVAGSPEPPREVTWPAPRFGEVAGRDGSASRGFDPRPEGNGPIILLPTLQSSGQRQTLTPQNLEGRSKARAELRRGRGLGVV